MILLLSLAFAQPDLVVSSVTVPATLCRGEWVDIDYTVENSGTVSAGASTTRLKLSDDIYYNLADPFLCDDFVGSLSASSSVLRSVSCYVPLDATVGTTWVVMDADAFGDVAESNNLNNYGDAATSVGQADLQFQSITPLTGATAGGSMDFDVVEVNIGDCSAESHTNRFRLSADSTYDWTDTLLCDDTPPSLDAGMSQLRMLTCGVPSSVPASDFLVGYTDALEDVSELEEFNNSLGAAIDGVNLVLESLTVPSEVAWERSFEASATVRNAGLTDAPFFQVRLRMSTDSTYDVSDTTLCDLDVPSLAAGTTTTVSSSACLAPGWTSGQTIVARADVQAVVAETDENDNYGTESVTAGAPQLTPTGLTLGSATPGSSLTVDLDWENTGDVGALFHEHHVYLSQDAIVDPADTLLCQASSSGISAGDSDSTSISGCTLPGSLSGAWYVIARVDAGGHVWETNGTDNDILDVIVFGSDNPNDPQVDLVMRSATGPLAVFGGERFSVDYDILNAGSEEAEDVPLHVLLDDEELCSLDGLRLQPAGSSAGQVRACELPEDLVPGEHRLEVWVDLDDHIVEANEDNNVIEVYVELLDGEDTGATTSDTMDNPTIDSASDTGVEPPDRIPALGCGCQSTRPLPLSGGVFLLAMLARRRRVSSARSR